MNVPSVNGINWRKRRAQLGIFSDQAADLLGISGGHLRSIENDIKPSSWELAYRAARLYSCGVDELVAQGDGVPDEPPSKEQEKETNVGPGREGGNAGRGDKDKKRPKRATGAAA